MKQIGKIIHYYDKIGVAIIELKAGLKAGENVRIEKDGEGFEEKVESMQIDHKEVSKAKKGDVVGIKVKEHPKNNAEVYLLD
ncbi:hypothetical protein A3A21_02065 [Candidatus Jorgensenbacteria bacterium RIFCSPLOWO2_01_FULL_45_25b]|uniref:Translation elongation factor-like protein n=1 Tax=Candidatus Jorgensenbacteria bacterium RIFCSPLOWO2_01_FULL_45_25b TaxID=1798471 RepID=A0A1F6C059_9BACT|nr:MAG: hypothetical protein A3A21_02065 [Candidatus Jorgensenbacteria bacterium RIFCSPLOWO2_01_FULL_45_25b]